MSTKVIIALIIILALAFMARKLFVFVLIAAIAYFAINYFIKKRNEPAWYDVSQYF